MEGCLGRGINGEMRSVWKFNGLIGLWKENKKGMIYKRFEVFE